MSWQIYAYRNWKESTAGKHCNAFNLLKIMNHISIISGKQGFETILKASIYPIELKIWDKTDTV